MDETTGQPMHGDDGDPTGGTDAGGHAGASLEERHREFNRRMAAGEPMTRDLWLSHFEHQNVRATSGIAVGKACPDFELPDQYGTPRRRDDLIGESGLLLVFVRSAHW